MSSMKEQYGEDKGKKVFYASKNKGTIKGVEGKPHNPQHPYGDNKSKAMSHSTPRYCGTGKMGACSR